MLKFVLIILKRQNSFDLNIYRESLELEFDDQALTSMPQVCW